ncbi:uncharacterized protein FYW61_015774 isoform 3-T5 [Anableps anableps]
MFACETSAVVKNVGAEEELISNSNLNQRVDLLTLVRVSEGKFFNYPKYKTVDCTLPELMEEEFSPEVEEELVVKDFKTSVESNKSGKLGGDHAAVGEAAISAKCDSVDGLVEPVNIKKKKANLKAVRKTFSGRILKKDKIKLLKLKEKDKLAFVHETLYNTGPVKMFKKSAQEGSISASYQKLLNLLFQGSRTEETTFTVPEKSTFAFGLQEITLENERMGENNFFLTFTVFVLQFCHFFLFSLEIPLETWTHRKNLGLFTHDSIDPDVLQLVREGIKMKEFLLKPLTGLGEVTRQNLLKKLQDVLKEAGALSLLEETVRLMFVFIVMTRADLFNRHEGLPHIFSARLTSRHECVSSGSVDQCSPPLHLSWIREAKESLNVLRPRPSHPAWTSWTSPRCPQRSARGQGATSDLLCS